MAEYYTLLMRAVEGLPNKTQTARRAVYDRARAALINQLRSLDPPISETEIVKERLALDEAIQQIETDLAQAKAEPTPPEPEKPDLDLLPEASFQPPKSQNKESQNKEPQIEEPQIERSHFEEPSLDTIPGTPLGSSLEREPVLVERPRMDIVEREPADKRSMRSILFASTLAALIASVAILALYYKDKPAAPLLTGQPGPLTSAADQKFSGRIGEEKPAMPPQVAAPAPQTAPSSDAPPLIVAQRAVMYEENPGSGPRIAQGRSIWRLETVNAGQGRPLEYIVKAQLTIPDNALTLNLLMRRNLDTALPASHTVELIFSTSSNDAAKAIRDVGLLQMKSDEAATGQPLLGLPVPVKDNHFLIGLSNLSADQERNKNALLQRNWIDIPVRYASGQRAIISLEKGSSGDNAFNEAFKEWAK